MQLIAKLNIHSWLYNNKGKINKKMGRYEEESFEVCNSPEVFNCFVCLLECFEQEYKYRAQYWKCTKLYTRKGHSLPALNPNIQDSLLNENMCHYHWYYFYRDIWLPVFQTFSLSIQRIVFGAIAFNLCFFQ